MTNATPEDEDAHPPGESSVIRKSDVVGCQKFHAGANSMRRLAHTRARVIREIYERARARSTKTGAHGRLTFENGPRARIANHFSTCASMNGPL